MSDGTGPTGDHGRAAHRPSDVFTVYSDDHGRTWHPGNVVACTTPEFKYPSESEMVELEDGRVMINMRSESAPYRRLISISPDGASNWSEPQFVKELFDPVCFGSICRLPGEKGQLVFINPDSRSNEKIGWELHKARIRENLTTHVSLDDGKTWTMRKVIDSGVAGYSDVIDGPDGALYCLYEHGGEMAVNDSMSVVKLTRDWLLGRDFACLSSLVVRLVVKPVLTEERDEGFTGSASGACKVEFWARSTIASALREHCKL